MKTSHIIFALVGIALLLKSRVVAVTLPTNSAIDNASSLHLSSDWYEDSWARLHGRDLSLDGNHPVSTTFNLYGVTNEMGWNYGWDGAINPAFNK